MKKTVLGVVWLVAVGSGASADEPKTEEVKKKAVDKALETFSGTWEIVAAKPEGIMKEARKLVFRKDLTYAPLDKDGTELWAGTFNLDPTATPKVWDHRSNEVAKKGGDTLGIYELNGDTLKVCSVAGTWKEKQWTGKRRPTAGWVPFEPDRDAERKRQEQLYLDATAKWLTSMSPVSATAGVLSGSAVLPATVADGILERVRAGKPDLIVMATHGRGPLGRFMRGSVADELIRRARVPVLLVRPSDKASGIIPETVLDNILIPLDGSALAEQVLEPALDLARLMEARCSLLRVVEPRSSPADRAPGGPPEKAQAEAYLERVAARVREQGVPVRTRVVVARHAVEAILEEAAAQASNLIGLATHGRGGLQRLLRGSVADKLVRAAASPVLVYRATGPLKETFHG